MSDKIVRSKKPAKHYRLIRISTGLAKSIVIEAKYYSEAYSILREGYPHCAKLFRLELVAPTTDKPADILIDNTDLLGEAIYHGLNCDAVMRLSTLQIVRLEEYMESKAFIMSTKHEPKLGYGRTLLNKYTEVWFA